MKELLADLIKKIQRYSNSYASLDLIEGLDDQSIKALEKEWAVEFPESLKTVLKYCGKTVKNPTYIDMIITVPHYGEMGLASMNQMLKVHELLMASDYQQKVKHDCKDILERGLWNPKWIPVAAYGNDSIHDSLSLYDLIILDEKSPLYQNIVHWNSRIGVVRVVASSYEDYIRSFYNDLDRMYWDVTYGFSF